tara:strand:- start:790 stop:954 length:165 start_codon:yes stop_codon:yes gene_type:complete
MSLDFNSYDGITYIYPLKYDCNVGESITIGSFEYEVLQIDNVNSLVLIREKPNV